jgi:HEAT repeat protein
MHTRCIGLTGKSIVVLCCCLALGVWARGAQQQPATSTQPEAPQQPKSAVPPATKPAVGTLATRALSAATERRKAWACLTDGMAEKNYDRRAQAIAALGTIGLRPDVVQLIETGLNDKDAPVRQAAVEVLGTMKSRGSLSKLRAALDDHSALVSFAAAQALWAMGDKTGEDHFFEILDGDRKVSVGMVRGGLKQVHEELHDPTALAELGAEQAAGAFLGPAGFGVSAAIEMSKDKAAPARAVSARLLAVDTSDSAREVLREALQDKSWIVRAAAAEAFGARGSLNDIATLASLLDDPQKEVRYRAAAAIIRVTSRHQA